MCLLKLPKLGKVLLQSLQTRLFEGLDRIESDDWVADIVDLDAELCGDVREAPGDREVLFRI